MKIMRRHVRVFALFLTVIAGMICAPAGFAQTPASAMRFLQKLYAPYRQNRNPPVFDEYHGKNTLASPSLRRLFQQEKQISQGEVGALDADPVCQCQDWDHLKITKIKVDMTGRKTARATVSFVDIGHSTHVRFDLVWIAGQWYIDDIYAQASGSVRQAVRRFIAESGKK